MPLKHSIRTNFREVTCTCSLNKFCECPEPRSLKEENLVIKLGTDDVIN